MSSIVRVPTSARRPEQAVRRSEPRCFRLRLESPCAPGTWAGRGSWREIGPNIPRRIPGNSYACSPANSSFGACRGPGPCGHPPGTWLAPPHISWLCAQITDNAWVMGTRHPHLGVSSRHLLSVVLILACGCSLFKKKDDEAAATAPLASASANAVAQPPVFNVNTVASATGTGGTTAEPVYHRVSRAGAAAKLPAGGASSAAAATTPAATAAATPTAAAAVPVVPQACINTCTATFTTCVQSGQLPVCQSALKTCMAACPH